MILLKYVIDFIFPNYKKLPYVLKGFVKYINDFFKIKKSA